MQSWLSICVEDASACGNGSRPVWGVDNVKSTVTVLEGNFTEEGVVSTEGVLFIWRIPLFVEKCVSFSRRESCSSGVGGHTLLGEGCVLTLRRGSYFTWGGWCISVLLLNRIMWVRHILRMYKSLIFLSKIFMLCAGKQVA